MSTSRVPPASPAHAGGAAPDGSQDGSPDAVPDDGPVPGWSPDVVRRARSRTRWALARLGLALAAIVVVFLLAGLGPLLVFIAALVACVFLHELGHYLTAKWSHMKVTEFFIGFGPRLWSVRRGETDYGIKPILAGAYVKIPGMTNLEQLNPVDEPRTYRQQPFSRRVLVASAGSIMHYVIALVLGIVLALSVGVPTGRTQVTVTGFTAWAGHRETAAQAAGVKAGDRILSVDGKQVSTAAQLSADIQAANGQPVALVVERDGRRSALTVQPQAGHTVTSGKTAGREVLGKSSGTSGKTKWLIGIQINVATVFATKSPWDALTWAGDEAGSITRLSVLGVGHAFSASSLSSLYHQVTNTEAADKAAANPSQTSRPLTIIGAARLATQAEAKGAFYFIYLLIALNIALGLLNMLPMLPLDGGHVVIAVYERVRTRRGRPYYRADVAKLLPVAYTFMALLVVFMGALLFLDIAHPIANPYG